MVLIFLNKKKKKQILGSSDSQGKAATGGISWFPTNVSVAVWAVVGGGGSTSEEGEKKLIEPEQILAVSEVKQW